MKKLNIFILTFSIILLSLGFVAAKVGEKCTGDASCDFGEVCKSGVCIKSSDFDFGSSGKTGNPCQIDADCIGSGKCVSNGFGEKFCSGE